MSEYFKNPNKFDPWRWLDKTKEIHPYAVLPFGHGARMCPGRRFAEQEIFLCISEVRFGGFNSKLYEVTNDVSLDNKKIPSGLFEYQRSQYGKYHKFGA